MIAEDHRQLIDTVGASPLAMVVSNPRLADNPIEVANPAFCSLTGYPEADIVGRNCRFLAGAATEPWVTDQIRDAICDRRPVLVDILNYRNDGTPFRNGVMITPLFDPEGGLAWFLGSQVDLGEPSANPYLYMASQILSGLDGVDRALDPGPSADTPYETKAELLDVMRRAASQRTSLVAPTAR